MKACFDWHLGENLAPPHGRQTRGLFYSLDQGWAETYAYTPGYRVGGAERMKETSLAGGSMVENFGTVGHGMIFSAQRQELENYGDTKRELYSSDSSTIFISEKLKARPRHCLVHPPFPRDVIQSEID